MSEKRRGLGRGLGALIPTGTDGDRPVDVFFPQSGGPAGTQQGPPAWIKAVPTPIAASATIDAALSEAAAAEEVAAESSSSAFRGARRPRGGSARRSVSALSPVTGEKAPSPEAPTPTAIQPAPVAEPAVSRETTAARHEDTHQPDLVPVPGARFAELPVESIRPNARQPRTDFDEDELAELVESIREIGVLQPIVVRPVLGADGTAYELIMGERRWRATQRAGLSVVPAIIRETDDADLLRDALLENLHRSNLNPLEEAAAYRQLLDDFGCTHDELATRISRSRPQISNTLRLLRLPPLVQRRLAAGVLSAGHARALLGLADGAAIERLAQRIVAEGLSVRATEEIVSVGGDGTTATAIRRRVRAGDRNFALDDLATRLSDRFETKVKIALGKSKGKLVVEFASVQDLNRILETLSPQDPGVLRA